MKFTVWTPPAQFAVEEAGYLAMTLAWPDAAIEEDGYTLERSTDGQNWIAVAELSANTLRYVDYGLARHTRYGYRLTAHNDQTSADPQTVQAETAAEPVNFGEDWVEGEIAQTVIDYQYDALYRLTEANYSDGTFFHYAYDSNGNRVSETTEVGTVESAYDAANRLTSVGGVAYTWDANGNLTSDSVRLYAYNSANRLTGVTQNGQTVNYRYNGLGDRLVEGETEFEMDLNTGLTQVLADGTNTYLYGNGRIGQFTGVDSAYFLGDAMGSVRQLVNEGGVLMMTKNYEPYGEVIKSQGSGASKYGFAGEQVDRMELIYLRARYYSSDSGRFITRDTWEGNDLIPISYNAWLYGYSNPVKYTDPSGMFPPQKLAEVFGLRDFSTLLDYFEDNGGRWGWLSLLLDAREGDNFTAIYPHLSGTYPEWAIYDEGILNTRATSFWSLAAQLDRLNCYDPSVNSNQKSSFCRRNEDPFFPMWRDSSPHIYALNGFSGKGYIDYAFEQSDLPDFKSYNAFFPSLDFTPGVGVGLSGLVDSFGNVYLSGTISGGLSIGLFTYSEGYVAASANNAINGERTRITDEETLKNVMQGVCGGASADVAIGIGTGACPSLSDPFKKGGSGFVVYEAGLNFGVSGQITGTLHIPQYSNKNLGWQHLFNYRRNGTTRADVERKALLQYGRCK